MWSLNSNPIKIAQRAVRDLGKSDNLVAAIDEIVRSKRWDQRKSAKGVAFTSFGQFAIERRPFGLGVNSREPFRLVRFALVENRHFEELADLLDIASRRRGRPARNLANDEIYFNKVPTSYNTVDRTVLTLKRSYPHLLAELRASGLTPRQAAIQAGIPVAQSNSMRFGVCDFSKAKNLAETAQGKLLCELFHALPVDAQCALLSRCVEPQLGGDLARKWREKHHVAD